MEEEEDLCTCMFGEMGNIASLKELLPKSFFFFSGSPCTAVCELVHCGYCCSYHYILLPTAVSATVVENE